MTAAISLTSIPAATPCTLPAPAADAFPEALVRTPHWVGWKWGTRDGKRTKIPVNPHTGKNASSADPATWADFATARTFAQRHAYGLGFMLAPPFVGIDLDHCRDPATGELSTLGGSVLGELDTYAEVSISGTGIKAIAYGEKPGKRCRRNGLELEIYGGKRLFALTGQRLDDAPMQINDCQDAIDHIYTSAFGQTDPAPSAPAPAFAPTDDDRAVLDWLATYRPKFAPLWAGDTSAYNHDASAADQALCNMLAFRTGDENRVDSLFRQSGLYREKWERGDYRHATISKAMQQRRFFAPSTPTRSTVDSPPKTDDSPPWTDASPAPDLAALQQENARLRAELAAEREHRAAVHRVLANKHQTPTERIIAYALVFEVHSAASRGKAAPDDPEARPVNCTAIGDTYGFGHQTVSANITRLDQRGQLRKVTSKQIARNGTEIAVVLPGDSPLESLRAIATWQRPEGTKHVGGNGKRCSACGSENTRREVRIVCDDCGHVSKPLSAPAPVAAEETRGESWGAIMGLAPTRSTVDTPPEPEATPAPALSTVGGGYRPVGRRHQQHVERPRVRCGHPPPPRG